MKHIHINPQSKGSLGKSFETETRSAWLHALGVPWHGYDLDDRHCTFKDRHPDNVDLVSLEDGAKDAVLGLIKDAINRPEAVILIDSRAQADALIIQAFEALNIFQRVNEAGARFVVSLFPSDDNESLNNLAQIAKWAYQHARFLVVRNPAKARARSFDVSPLKTTLETLGSRTITIPDVTQTTLQLLEKCEKEAGRAIPFSEFAAGYPGADPICTGEIAYLLGQMSRQYCAIADLLLPESELPKVPQPEAPKSVKPNKELDFSL